MQDRIYATGLARFRPDCGRNKMRKIQSAAERSFETRGEYFPTRAMLRRQEGSCRFVLDSVAGECFIPAEWKEAPWDKFVMGSPRTRMQPLGWGNEIAVHPLCQRCWPPLYFPLFSGGRDRTMTWDIHQSEERLC